MSSDYRICGLDEAGRGALAGPLVAAAVIFPPEFRFSERFPKLRFGDSKALTPHQREAAVTYIYEWALEVQVEQIEVADINTNGIGWANRNAFETLILKVEADRYVVDGNLKLERLGSKARRTQSVVRADQTIQAVAAASIVAKVRRDRLMAELHAQHPEYGWDHNRGYGTPTHLLALKAHGLTAQHRRQFVVTALNRPQKLPGFETRKSELSE
ncbi:MAG: ribonuclease HII [Anaerolineae bacterium]